MAEYKAVGVVFLREWLRRLGDETEQRYLQRLDERLRELYECSLSISWIEAGDAAALIQPGLDLVLPGQANPAREFGRQQAHHDLGGVYKILLAVASVPMVIKQSAKLWSTYHRRGQASVERDGSEPRGTMVVRGYPELPELVRITTTGYIAGCLERSRASNVAVVEDFSDPQAWRWQASWA